MGRPVVRDTGGPPRSELLAEAEALAEQCGPVAGEAIPRQTRGRSFGPARQ